MAVRMVILYVFTVLAYNGQWCGLVGAQMLSLCAYCPHFTLDLDPILVKQTVL